MTSMETQLATGLATAQNQAIECAAKVAEIHGARMIAADIRLLKTTAHDVLEGAKSATPKEAA